MNPVRSVDDFHEFFALSYRAVLTALEEAGLVGSIEAGAVGHYLLVARAARTPDIGEPTTVEVTSAGLPLPDDPADVRTWMLTRGSEQVLVPAEAGAQGLAEAIAKVLHAA